MRVLVCPDCFTGTMTADQVAVAIAAGWVVQRPRDEVSCVPLSDGGPGFVDAAVRGAGARRRVTTVTGPTGRPVAAEWAMVGQSAWLEAAAACGLHLVPESQRDPRVTTTRGVGELVAAAVAAGATTVTIGVGGTSTNDAGAGMLSALGATVQHGRLDAGGASLAEVAGLDLRPARAAVAGISLRVATDVDNPLTGLRGATAVYAPQKGADAAAVSALDTALAAFAAVAGRRPDGRDPAVALGAGAGGGLGYGLLQLGAHREPGIATVIELVGLPQRVATADLVLTGEGMLDDQSLRGKVVSGVVALARQHGRPCVVVAGQVRLGRRELGAAGIDSAYSMSDMVGLERSLSQPQAALEEVAGRVARAWGGSRE